MSPESQPNQNRPKGLRITKHLVFLAMISAFFAGLATAEILGPRIFHGIPMGLAIFAVVTCVVGAVLLGLAGAKDYRS